jgi:hypothetical protein
MKMRELELSTNIREKGKGGSGELNEIFCGVGNAYTLDSYI